MAELTDLLMKMLRLLPPEAAHHVALRALAGDGLRGASSAVDPLLACRRWGLDFRNPIGLAAGFDKDGEAWRGALRLGFGFVEIGSVTKLPQPGNPKPRLFRVPELRAVVNRMGFNSAGHEAVAARLADRDRARGIVGVNLGKNKDQDDAAADYVAGVARFGPLADYLVVNVSSPNTAGLRALQARVALEALLGRVMAARDALAVRPPLLLKVSPDLNTDERRDVAEVALAARIDGLIASNTTTRRPTDPMRRHRHLAETGGLSGAPLFAPSTDLLRDLYRLTEGKITLVGVGGIGSGLDAYRKIRAGASLVQLYTALVYAGPGLVAQISRDLAECLREDGFASVDAAVGADHRAG
ncbi:MAG: quinone-dependent dihydroorotate dehydrogenase [Rhodospirillaceae bacterium]|nr:quinone-dependent dihydroorotate dehydrogenase [Rhodospirillaceae bacterium]